MKDLEPLRLFLNLSRTLHFARASEQSHVSTSTMSRTIRSLEEDLGVTLFARDRRNVALTPEGMRFQAFVSDLLDGWNAFDRSLRDEGTLSGTIAIFCTVTASQSIVPDALRRFRNRHPNVHVKLETGYAANALAMLDDDAIDVTIAALPERLPKALVVRRLTATPLLFVAPSVDCEVSRAVRGREIDWGKIPMIVAPFGLARDYTERWFRSRRAKPTIYAEIPSHEAILTLVSLGCGVGVVPKLVLENSSLRESLRTVAVRPPLPQFLVGACARRSRLQSPLVAAFWNEIA